MKLQVSSLVNTPASTAWKILGEEFADISKWNDAILKSSLDGEVGKGATRTCELKSGPVTELLTRYEPKSHALTYEIRSGLPSFMGTVENAWTIQVVDENSCRVSSVITANMRWYARPIAPLIKMNLRKLVSGALDQLGTAAQARQQSDNRKAV